MTHESRPVTMYLPEHLLTTIDKIRDTRRTGGVAPSRSAVVRDLLRVALRDAPAPLPPPVAT